MGIPRLSPLSEAAPALPAGLKPSGSPRSSPSPFPALIPGSRQTRGPEPEELDAKSRELLTQQAAQCLSKLVQIAPRARRNFILDQVSRDSPIPRKPAWKSGKTSPESPAKIPISFTPKIPDNHSKPCPQKSPFHPRPGIPGQPDPGKAARKAGKPPPKSPQKCDISTPEIWDNHLKNPPKIPILSSIRYLGKA